MSILLSTLKKYFGYNSFREGQEEIIGAILSHNNVLTILPTGAGKSICYQVPALISDNYSIVISPLIALMKDQVDSLNQIEEVAAFINSTMEYHESETVLSKIAFGKIKLLYLSPEKLESIKFAERLIELNPSHLFIDEAHCISEWGHNFRPGYMKIREFIDYSKIKKIAAFTATATPEVVEDIIAQLKFKEPKIFVRGFERENLHLNVILTKNKKHKCLELIKQHPGSAIIYTASRKNAEEASEFLNMYGINCTYYHAGLTSIERRRIQDDFINGNTDYIAATNAFGMGIDKKDIRLIIHYNVTGSIENYYQEIGRAGRDGEESFAYLLYDQKDLAIQNFFLTNAHPEKLTIQKIYKAICDFNRIAVNDLPNNELIIDPDYISKYAGSQVSKGLLFASLRYLESSGYLRLISEFEKKDSFKFLVNKERLKDFVSTQTNEELKNALLLLLREYGSQPFLNEIKFSVFQLASKLNIPQMEFIDSLRMLDNLGFITFQESVSKDTLVLTAPRAPEEKLKLNFKKINESFINSQRKLDQMVEFVFSKQCRFRYILGYFGEDVKEYKCGKCDNCTQSSKISSGASEYISEIILKSLAEAGQEISESALLQIIQGERTKKSIEQFEFFGACEKYSKEELRIVIHELIAKGLIKHSSGKIKYLDLTKEGIKKLNDLGWKKITESTEENYEEDLVLFNLLREVRKKAAEKFLQTGYLICPDEVLRRIIKEKPKTKSELINVKGFNPRMYNKLGDDFLEVLSNYSPVKFKADDKVRGRTIPQNINETYNLLLKKYSLREISELRKISEAVVSMQIETILEYKPDTDIAFLFQKGEFEKIAGVIKTGAETLKEYKNKLPSNISYAMIRIAAAKLRLTSPA